MWKDSEHPSWTILNGSLCVLVEPDFEDPYVPAARRRRARPRDDRGLPAARAAPVARSRGLRRAIRRRLQGRGGPRQLRLHLPPPGAGRAQGQEVRRQAQPHQEIRIDLRPRIPCPDASRRPRLLPAPRGLVRGEEERRSLHEGREGGHRPGAGLVRAPRSQGRRRQGRRPRRGLHHGRAADRRHGRHPHRDRQPRSRRPGPMDQPRVRLPGMVGLRPSSTGNRTWPSRACARRNCPTSRSGWSGNTTSFRP